MNDPYSILGVSKTSTDSEIKSAYRKLAKQSHPDAGGDKNRFAEVSNAYNQIKDADSRQNFENQQFDPSNFQHSHFEQHFGDFDNIFNNMFGSRGGPFQNRNRDIELTYHVDIKDVFDGATKNINVKMPNGMSKPVTVTIPRGIKQGNRVQYAGMSPMGGDLYVKFIIKKNMGFTIDSDNNLLKLETIPLRTAMFGGEIIVTTLDDRSIKVKIAPGTQSGSKLRIPESGLPRRNLPNADLLIEIKVIIPKMKPSDLNKTLIDIL